MYVWRQFCKNLTPSINRQKKIHCCSFFLVGLVAKDRSSKMVTYTAIDTYWLIDRSRSDNGGHERKKEKVKEKKSTLLPFNFSFFFFFFFYYIIVCSCLLIILINSFGFLNRCTGTRLDFSDLGINEEKILFFKYLRKKRIRYFYS